VEKQRAEHIKGRAIEKKESGKRINKMYTSGLATVLWRNHNSNQEQGKAQPPANQGTCGNSPEKKEKEIVCCNIRV
jgi:hypothetical protein